MALVHLHAARALLENAGPADADGAAVVELQPVGQRSLEDGLARLHLDDLALVALNEGHRLCPRGRDGVHRNREALLENIARGDAAFEKQLVRAVHHRLRSAQVEARVVGRGRGIECLGERGGVEHP